MTNDIIPGKDHTVDTDRLIRAIFIGSIVIIVFLIIADYVFNYVDVLDEQSFRRIWNIAREQSIPTWFSSIQAQLLGVTVMAIAWIQAGEISRVKTIIWLLIGLFFLWIGIDDFAEIHEKLGGVLERLAAKGENSAVTEIMLQNPSFSWHTFIAPFFALCGLGILLFLWLSFWRLRLVHFLILGFGCWAVAQGLDFIEGLDDVDIFYDEIQQMLSIRRKYGVTHLFKVIEEVLEMLGTTLLWVGFLHYLAHVSNGHRFTLKAKAGSPSTLFQE
jgi:hypothetical protein